MQNLYKATLWILTFFFGMSAIAFLPHYSGAISVVVTLLLLPIDKWQKSIQKIINLKLKRILIIVLFVVMVGTVPTENRESDSIAEPVVEDAAVQGETVAIVTTDETSWKKGLPAELVSDIECAFVEIGENPDYIESIEYVDTVATAFFCKRDYKITFDKGSFFDMLSPETWVHSRFYRITTQEWFDSEPEKDLYPREYLSTIKFWRDDNKTNINQWTDNGLGELQNSDNAVAITPNRDNIVVAYSVSVSELVDEIKKDKESAGEKYNGQWIEISGTVTDVSESAGMTGYYLWGESGGSGLNITCWVEEMNDTDLSVGDTVTFIGAMRDISAVNNTEIGLCAVK